MKITMIVRLQRICSRQLMWIILLLSVIATLSLILLRGSMKSFSKAADYIDILEKRLTIPVIDQKIYIERMREVFAEQANIRRDTLNNYDENQGSGLLYAAIVPEAYCPGLIRLGWIGDGGKWICAPFNVPSKSCSIFSVGLSNEISFDEQFQKLTQYRCHLYALDMDEQNEQVMKKLSTINATFKKAKLGAQLDPNNNLYTFDSIMEIFNVTSIEILKIDIEGGEYDVIGPLIASHIICQILIEIHRNPTQVISLLKTFARQDYYLFSRELNSFFPTISEFSFIHASCMGKYNVIPLARYLN